MYFGADFFVVIIVVVVIRHRTQHDLFDELNDLFHPSVGRIL